MREKIKWLVLSWLVGCAAPLGDVDVQVSPVCAFGSTIPPAAAMVHFGNNGNRLVFGQKEADGRKFQFYWWDVSGARLEGKSSWVPPMAAPPNATLKAIRLTDDQKRIYFLMQHANNDYSLYEHDVQLNGEMQQSKMLRSFANPGDAPQFLGDSFLYWVQGANYRLYSMKSASEWTTPKQSWYSLVPSSDEKFAFALQRAVVDNHPGEYLSKVQLTPGQPLSVVKQVFLEGGKRAGEESVLVGLPNGHVSVLGNIFGQALAWYDFDASLAFVEMSKNIPLKYGALITRVASKTDKIWCDPSSFRASFDASSNRVALAGSCELDDQKGGEILHRRVYIWDRSQKSIWSLPIGLFHRPLLHALPVGIGRKRFLDGSYIDEYSQGRALGALVADEGGTISELRFDGDGKCNDNGGWYVPSNSDIKIAEEVALGGAGAVPYQMTMTVMEKETVCTFTGDALGLVHDDIKRSNDRYRFSFDCGSELPSCHMKLQSAACSSDSAMYRFKYKEGTGKYTQNDVIFEGIGKSENLMDRGFDLIGLSHDGRCVVNRGLEVYCISSESELRKPSWFAEFYAKITQWSGLEGKITQLSWSKDDKWVFGANAEGDVAVWGVFTREALQTKLLDKNSSPVLGGAWVHDRVLATLQQDGTLTMWSIPDGTVLSSQKLGNEYVKATFMDGSEGLVGILILKDRSSVQRLGIVNKP